MKRKWMYKGTAALLAAVLLCGGLAACGEKKPEETSTSSKVTVSHPVDVIAEAAAGRMTGTEIDIGKPIEDVKKYYRYVADGESTDGSSDESLDESALANLPPLDISEGQTMVRMSTGSIDYYYRKAEENKGVSMIVSLVDAYGFEMGITMPDDVKAAVSADGQESVPTADDLFFLPEVPGDCLRITYQAGSKQVDFFFVDEFLSAVTLCEPAWWNGSGSDNSTSNIAASDNGTSEGA